MKWPLTLINCMLVGGLLCACVAPPPPQPTPDEIAEDIIVRINKEREALGLEPFVVNEQLMMIARWLSQDMADGDYFSHDPPPGHPTLADFNEQLGYERLHAPQENLVYIDRTEDQTVMVKNLIHCSDVSGSQCSPRSARRTRDANLPILVAK